MDEESSLSLGHIRKHEVFVSFRAEDTGNNFCGNLISALKERSMLPFMSDDEDEAVSPELLKAIELSPISIVVFSRNYAASTCCLEELEHIAECHDLDEQTVLPVFYDVDPSEVKEQRGVYQQAFAEHEERFEEDLEKVERWRESMTIVANLSGWDLQNEIETEVIHNIVKKAMILNHRFLNVEDDLVGMLHATESVEHLLYKYRNVEVIGIRGMSGIGKTALAKLVYNRVSWQFDVRCFLADVTKVSKLSGVVALQEQLLRQILMQKNVKIRDVNEGTSLICTHLRGLKTLLVVDDVSRLEQLEALAINAVCSGKGTRVLITSRDTKILQSCADGIYHIEPLNIKEALQLFSRHAFKSSYPEKHYEDLTCRALKCLEGNPLAIKLMGSFLLNQSVSQWKSVVARLEKIPDLTEKIYYVVRESFNSLEYSGKEMFLDIACLFIGEKIDYVKETLHSCGYNPEIGIRNLIDRLFITILDQRIQMHDLVQETGLQVIIQQSFIEPGAISRLWFKEELYHVMKTNEGTELVEAVVLNPDVLQNVSFWAEALSKMRKLRLFIFRQYPLTCLPSGFEPHTLVGLVMSNSSITQLWEGIKTLPNLRSMDLRYSRDLIKTPDFRGLLSLERLDLEGCTGLLQVDSSNGILPNLKFLNMRNCKSLISVPNDLFGLSSLEYLNFAGCSKLEECLDFANWRSSIEVKVLSNQEPPFLELLSYYTFISFPEKIKNSKLAFGCFSCLFSP